MAKVERFEDLLIWQKSIELTKIVYKHTEGKYFSKDFGLRDQVRRSAVSIPSNIAEGFERESNRQLVYFLLVAKASAGELRTQLFIAKELNYITEKEYQLVYDNLIECSKGISSFVKYLRTVTKK